MVTREEYSKIRQSISPESNIKLFKSTFLDRITIVDLVKENIYIDLFINEDMPKNRFVFFHKKNTTRFLRNYFSVLKNERRQNDFIIKRLIYIIARRFLFILSHIYVFKRNVFDLNDKKVAIKKAKPSGILTRFTSRMYETKRRFNKKKYLEGYGVVIFRGYEFMAIINARTFLNEMFGDYTTMIPEEKRKPSHSMNMMENHGGNYIKWLN